MNGIKKISFLCVISVGLLINYPSKVIGSEMETDVGIELTVDKQGIKQQGTVNSKPLRILPQTNQLQDSSLFMLGLALIAGGGYLCWHRKESGSK